MHGFAALNPRVSGSLDTGNSPLSPPCLFRFGFTPLAVLQRSSQSLDCFPDVDVAGRIHLGFKMILQDEFLGNVKCCFGETEKGFTAGRVKFIFVFLLLPLPKLAVPELG